MRSLGSLVLTAALTACATPPGDGTTAAGGDPGKADGARAATGVLDSFETDGEAAPWTEASWASAGTDAGGAPLSPRRGSAGVTSGRSALAVPVRFTGAGYEQAYVGRAASRSMAGAAALGADLTVPADAPAGLRAKLVLQLGPDAVWSEPAAATELAPGATTHVTLPLAGAFDPVPERAAIADVRGYGVKLDGTGVAWSGEVALDQVRLEPAPLGDADLVSVGTFGGFQRPAGPDVPTRNGFLTFVADTNLFAHALVWPKLGDGGADRVVGTARFLGSGTGALRVLDWTTVRTSSGGVTATMSRAFPAVRYTIDAGHMVWSGPVSALAVALDGRPTVLGAGGSLARMSEPWLVVFGERADDAPVLLTFERRPSAAVVALDQLVLDWSGSAGAVNVMPLYGLRRVDSSGWSGDLPADPLNRARVLVPVLAGFPVGCAETSAVGADTVTVTDSYQFEDLADDWGTAPVHAAPVPPVVSRAADSGYPIGFEATPQWTGVATFFGELVYVPGGVARYTLPLPAGLARLPVALRVSGDADGEAARAEVEALVRTATPAQPMPAFLDNDDRAAAFLAEALPTLPADLAPIARSFATRGVEHGWLDSSLQELVEPVTGQRYLNNAKYWASAEPFDKEWYAGRQLAALALVAENVDLDVARGVWDRAKRMYRYDRIFFDWATGSVASSVYGWTELCDGIHFAWEGMLGVARLARLLGDDAVFADAATRAARQETALYAAWFHAAWAKDIDYGIGHVTNGKLAAADVDTRVAIDGWVEDFGAATLEVRSFWQTTNYLFFDNVPQLPFYRDSGLSERVRALEYDIMPAAHPHWTDANVLDPVDNRYYGTEYTAAHVMARALLFHEPGLLAIYDAADGAEGSKQWYSMRRFGIGGPTLLAIERAAAPTVEVPVGLVRVDGASWDGTRLRLELVGRASGRGAVRIDGSDVAIEVQAGKAFAFEH
jgi:hypothetical protein